jgi:uncharacterized protein (DUF433 family)
MSKLKTAFESGEGFYTVSEVALYARMHPKTVRNWFLNKTRPTFRKATSTVEPNLLTFTDLVEAIYVRRLRTEFNISFSVIRTAIDMAIKLKNVAHPFAHPEFRTVLVGKREINIIEREKPSVMTALAPNSGQQSDCTILSDFIEDLEFSADRKIIKHIAFKAVSDRIIIAPNFNFGAPIMENSGYPAEVLWTAARVEGGAERAAEIYGVDVSTVQAAVEYYGGVLQAA